MNYLARSADFQSAVSPICNRQDDGVARSARNVRHLADCKSAIQSRSGGRNLRYAAKALVFGLAVALQPGSVLACAACYGQSDSPMAQGMNWGIFSLLAVVVSVLGSIAGFFIYLAKRSGTNF